MTAYYRTIALAAGTALSLAAGSAVQAQRQHAPLTHRLGASAPDAAQWFDNSVSYALAQRESSTQRNALGAQLFKTHCAACHGTAGRGDGPLAGELRRVPPDLTKYTARNGGVFPTERVHRIIDGREVRAHGERDMPVWGDAFMRSREGATAESVKARIDAIVRYLQDMQERSAE